MSLKRSDILPRVAAAPPSASGWWDTFKANAPIPIVLIAIFFAGMFVEGKFVGAYNQRVVMLIGFNIILAVSLQLINGFSGQFSLGHAGFMAVGAYMAAYPAVNLSDRLSDPASCLWFFVTPGVLVAGVGTALVLLFWALRATRKIH